MDNFASLKKILDYYNVGNMLHVWISDYYWLSRLVFAVSYVSGMFTIFRALYYLKVYGEARTMMATQSSMAAPIAMFICGASLIFLPTAIDTLTYTLYSTNTLLTYDTGGTGYGNFLLIMSLVVQLFGLIAVVRGFLMLADIGKTGGHPPGFTTKGVVHLIGGIMAMNFWSSLSLFSHLFGIFWL